MQLSIRGLAAIVAAACLAFPFAGNAASGKAPKEPPAKPLDFQKSERVKNGKFAYVAGTTKGDANRYIATNVLVTQPVVVTLKSDNPKEKIKLLVTKTQWTKGEREISTGADGMARVAFRTQGDFGVVVSGAGAGKGYKMAVWVGDEVKHPMSPAVVPKAQWKRTDAKPAEAKGK